MSTRDMNEDEFRTWLEGEKKKLDDKKLKPAERFKLIKKLIKELQKNLNATPRQIKEIYILAYLYRDDNET